MAYKKNDSSRVRTNSRREKGSQRIGKSRPDKFSSDNKKDKTELEDNRRYKPKMVDRTNKKSGEWKTKKPSYDKHKETVKKENEDIRLNRYIASSGICSRREADKYIELGLIKVNGKVVKELGVKVKSSDKITFNDQIIRDQKKVYIVLNKPKSYVTTTKDSRGERIVTDLVKNCCKERIYPVGRLDKNTTGVLILTNDGELADQLTHPKYNKKKIYHVFLDKNIKKTDLETIVSGVELEDGFVAADAISYADETDKTQVGIEIHSGKNRIVRRIFEHLGFKVKKLDRVYFAGLTKKGVQRGKWRFLNDKEIAMLKMRSYV